MNNTCIICHDIATIEGYFYPAEKKNYQFQKDKKFGEFVRYYCCEKHLGINKLPFLKVGSYPNGSRELA